MLGTALALVTGGCGPDHPGPKIGPPARNPGQHPIVIVDTSPAAASDYEGLKGEAPTVTIEMPWDPDAYKDPATGTFTPVENDMPEGPVTIKNPGQHPIVLLEMGPAPTERTDKTPAHPLVIVRTNRLETVPNGPLKTRAFPTVVINLPENYPTPAPGETVKRYKLNRNGTSLSDAP